MLLPTFLCYIPPFNLINIKKECMFVSIVLKLGCNFNCLEIEWCIFILYVTSRSLPLNSKEERNISGIFIGILITLPSFLFIDINKVKVF